MAGHRHAAAVPLWISAERFEPYLRHAGHDHDKACELYEWAAELNSAAFQAVHYVEVILRNAIDLQLQIHRDENRSRIPWFLGPLGSDRRSQEEIEQAVATVRARLQKEDPRKDTRAQIVAGLTFGFWANLLQTRHEELWRAAIRKAFPHSSGRRADVAAAVFPLRTFRNRIAHHDSLLAVDVPFQVSRMIEVAGWIDPGAATWLRSTEKATALHAKRPVPRNDTVVVAAGEAWPLYQKVHAYVCQPGRSFQPVEHLAFYTGKAIQPEIAAIRDRVDSVEWTPAESRRRRATGDPRDRRLADIIDQSSADGWGGGRYQVFLLSAPGEPDHHTRNTLIPHTSTPGRGRAFTRSQRYAVRQQLISAATTSDFS
ncbi:hypothetical protein AB0J83_06190 [Actinoplanes sp. NPDC049596]|uniref:hypothetical protein n=1 Tax=unclassified Actinoplanes TaxID=2626549 RepID=UPI00341B276C